MSIPAVCDRCGKAFISLAIGGPPGSRVAFKNVGVGPCPHCGNDSGTILDGTYEFTEGVAKIVADWQPAQILRLAQEVQAAQGRGDTEAEIVALIEKDSSALADWLRECGKPGNVLTLLGILVAILIALSQGSGNTVNNYVLPAQNQGLPPQHQPHGGKPVRAPGHQGQHNHQRTGQGGGKKKKVASSHRKQWKKKRTRAEVARH